VNTVYGLVLASLSQHPEPHQFQLTQFLFLSHRIFLLVGNNVLEICAEDIISDRKMIV